MSNAVAPFLVASRPLLPDLVSGAGDRTTRSSETVWRILALVLALGACSDACAEPLAVPERDPEVAFRTESPVAPREGRARFFENGQLDFSYFLENPRGFLPVPIVVTEPAVGYGGGGVGMFVRPRKEAGEEGWARPDISAVGAVATQNGTRGAFAGDVSRWMDGRLRTLVGGGGGKINLDFYGLGVDRSSLDQKVRYSLQFTAAIAQANWQLAPKSPWSLGMRYVYANVEPKLRDDAVFPGLADRVRVKVSAPTAVAEFDTRDNIFTPARGAYAESSLLASREALGASVDFERFEQILMGWHPLARDVTLGVRANYAWSSTGTPFFLRPFIMLRGVPAMRYQGDQMASTEAELRWQFHGRWSLVAFGGAGATRTSRDAFSNTQSVGSGGLGFRYELASKFGMHVGVDVAHSPGTTAIYFQVGNAWFRP
jgi:hypothetical protein